MAVEQNGDGVVEEENGVHEEEMSGE